MAIAMLAAILPLAMGVGGAVGEPGWPELQTLYTTIRYQDTESLLQFERNIRFGLTEWRRDPSFADMETGFRAGLLAQKVDAIFLRVQTLLGMHKKMENVTITVYGDRAQMEAAYRAMFSKACGHPAWYVHGSRTVYLNARNLTEGMLAHELAHAVIDSYLVIRPPAASAEILARHVDRHLHDRPAPQTRAPNLIPGEGPLAVEGYR